jgi:Domain of unknown function (DUF202)
VTKHTEKARGSDVSTVLAVDRTRLAYDRTMLSWIRTATSLITFGFSIEEFFRVAKTGMQESKALFGPLSGTVSSEGGLSSASSLASINACGTNCDSWTAGPYLDAAPTLSGSHNDHSELKNGSL